MFRLFYKILKRFFWIVVGVSFVVALYNVFKPLPVGLHYEGEPRVVDDGDISFFADTTFVDSSGTRHSDQHIFDDVFSMIKNAREYILIDAFLYNAYQGASPETTRALSGELTTLLLQKKKALPDIAITVITDPINEVYGGEISEQFEQLRVAGINVVTTDLTKLRDSNPLYSGFWRTTIWWFGNSSEGGSLPHPFQSGGKKISVRSWLTLFNFKANHRKLVVADGGAPSSKEFSTLIMSANPHDGSSAHGNIAIKVSGDFYRDVVSSESSVASFSGNTLPALSTTSTSRAGTGETTVQLLTEGAIQDHFLETLKKLGSGDRVDMAMFYLSERSIVNELIRAAKRGVSIRLVLDPNKDAFGHKKNGVPNRPVADELVSESEKPSVPIQIRWCDTHGEQCHAKLTLIEHHGGYEMIGGSANLTRRNIADYNLETNIAVESTEKIKAIADAYDYFETIWNNRGGAVYTADYSHYEDDAFYKKVMYRVMEFTGLSSF